MFLYRNRRLGGFSDSQSWAQQSEIKKQNQKKLGRGQRESRVLSETAETRRLGESYVEDMQTGGRNAQPQSQMTQRLYPHPAYQRQVSGSSTALLTGGQKC